MKQGEGEDYVYRTDPHPKGFISHLYVPAWDSETFYGTPHADAKEAEFRAALAFLGDKKVIEAAKNLPPPMETVHGYVKSQNPSLPPGQIRERARQLYCELAEGCTTAINENKF